MGRKFIFFLISVIFIVAILFCSNGYNSLHKEYITIEYASLLSDIEDEQSISNQDSYARFKDKGNICLKRNIQIRNLKSSVDREINSRKAFGLAFCHNATINNLFSQKSNNKIPLYLYTRNLLI